MNKWECCHEELVVRFLKDEFGATAIEYGLIAALIAVGIIAAARALGSQVGLTFNTVADEMKKLAYAVDRRLRLASGSFANRRTTPVFERILIVLELAVLTVLPGAVAFAAAMDLLTMKIPNRVSALMVLAFFPLAALAGLGAWDILYHVAAGLAVLLLGVLLFIPGWFGGGDAKLMAAIALWIGPENLFPYIF